MLLKNCADGDFFFLDDILPGIGWDAKYAGEDNFLGRPADGYPVNRLIGTAALFKGIKEAANFAAFGGCELFLWDAYRPKRAVEDFLRWAAGPEEGDISEDAKKPRYYPRISRREIIEKGYVARISSHSRGGAVDLTLCRAGQILPMGGDFDLMDERSRHGAAGLTDEESGNRRFLREIMERAGFEAYEREWWHYTLMREPYPNTCFDFISL